VILINAGTGRARRPPQRRMTIARRGHIDAAILDVNLHGEPVYPLASQLHEAGVHFMFVSAYGKPGHP
jgi:DNA-binding response OmpR family regulator